MKGALYGIGVGPGAPDLITLRAATALGEANVILAASSASNDYSIALQIAKPHLRPGARIEYLDFPMTRDKRILANAWREAARITVDILDNGENAAFITLGDPLIYSTFAYLQKAVKELEPDIAIKIIPGITSMQAAAARTGLSLCEGAEPFLILPGIAPGADLVKYLENNIPAAILKVYRNHEAIKKALAATGRADNCIEASFVEQENEKIRRGPGQGKPPYMTLILSLPGRG